MIPAWKLQRELQRLGQQLRAIPEFLYEPFLQRAHDRRFARGLPMTEGALPVSGRVALLLVFAPAGLPESVLLTCAHLQARGYAPLIVSNAPLGQPDLDRLKPLVWRIVERPNYGYDFGGYRDGILSLKLWGIMPDRLLILNDSVWFPLAPDETLIARLEGLETDIAGTILREKGEIRFLESYCYLVSGAAFAAPAFQDFWQGMKLTGNKYKVIRRSERGHSVAMAQAGMTLRPAYPKQEFLELLAARDDAFLRLTLIHAAYAEAALEAERDRLIAGPEGAGWRIAADAHVDKVLERGQFYSSFPFATVRLLGYPILKKSSDRVSLMWRRAYLRAVEAGDLSAPPAPILAEIRARTPFAG